MLKQIPHYLTLLLIVFPVWAAGGTYRAWQPPFLWLSLLAWLGYGLQRFVLKTALVEKAERDPGFWASLAFIGFLFLQFARTTRVRYFSYSTQEWTYSPPRWQFSWLEWIPANIAEALPWSFVGKEALEKLHWFIPILTVALLVRYHWKVEGFRPILVTGVLLNGIANAILSFIHLSAGWVKMYNQVQFGKDVYGSFGYPNHGAIYFILLLGLAVGCLTRGIMKFREHRSIPFLLLSGLATLLFILAANFSTSRSGLLGTWILLAGFLLSIGLLAWPRVHPVTRVLSLAGVAVLIGLLGLMFMLFAKPIHMRELRNATTQLDVSREINARFWQIETSLAIWADYPVYGVGGWGYRYLVAEYLPPEEWGKLGGKGKANVHNDFAQFLAEFGLLGTTLLLIPLLPAVGHMLKGLPRRPTDPDSVWSDPVKTGCFWALIILFLVAQFDIPLRSPAVFIHAVILLSFFYRDEREDPVWEPVVKWQELAPPPLNFIPSSGKMLKDS
jgi:O-antigen ligase